MIKKLRISFGLLIVIALISLPSLYFYNKYQKTQQLLENPNLASEKEAVALSLKVGVLIELPASETPTIATVSDQDKLKDQPFFQKSVNGDKVLIFTQGKKAILYRPSSNKIIEVASLNIGESEQLAAPLVASPNISVALYNGTTISGLTGKYDSSLSKTFNNINIAIKEQAAKSDYTKTLVVDISKKYPDMAKKLSLELSAEITSLPVGEAKPNSDILIIFGVDKQ